MKRKLTAFAAVVVLGGVFVAIGILLFRRPPQPMPPRPMSVTVAAEDAWALGTVRAADGTPLAGARVTFTNAQGSQSTITDDDGNFRLHVPAGDYSISVEAAGERLDLGTQTLSHGAPAHLALKTDFSSEAQRKMARLEKRIGELEGEWFTAPPPPAPPPPPEPPEPLFPPMPVPPPPAPPISVPVESADVGFEEQRCQDETAPCRVEVFFATDRNVLPAYKHPKRELNFQIAFGGERSRNVQQPLTYGWCDVTIPRNHRKTTGVLDGRAGTYDVENSVFVWDVVPAKDEEEFVARLRDRVDDDQNRDMLVFIHGYNVSFFEAARRTAQMHWDLGFRGAPAFFSWPSGGTLLDYWADEASSEWAAGHLREFLDLLAQRSGAKKIHLVAHSMGSRPLARALAEIGRRNPTCDPPGEAQFSQVIMAAPDMDRDMFLQLKGAMQNTAERVTLYASKKDRAMLGSWLLHRFARLGNPSGKPPVDVKIEAVDASNASTGFLGHSYYGASILWDVKFVLGQPQLRVEERCTIDRADPAGTYPRFRRQIDPKEVPPWWRRVLRRKPKPDVIGEQCTYPRADPVPIAAVSEP